MTNVLLLWCLTMYAGFQNSGRSRIEVFIISPVFNSVISLIYMKTWGTCFYFNSFKRIVPICKTTRGKWFYFKRNSEYSFTYLGGTISALLQCLSVWHLYAELLEFLHKSVLGGEGGGSCLQTDASNCVNWTPYLLVYRLFASKQWLETM